MFGASITSSWMLLSQVSELYWYYNNYGFKVCVISLVFTPYIYYHEFFCLGPASRIFNSYCHLWVRYIDYTKITVACMSSLLLSYDLHRYWYFIMFNFKLTNGAMDKWWMNKWYNSEIKIRIGCFVYHKYWICSFVLFSDTTFLQQTKQSIIFIIWSLTTSAETKCMLSNQATTERQDFIRGQPILVGDIATLVWFACFRNLKQSTTVTNQC